MLGTLLTLAYAFLLCGLIARARFFSIAGIPRYWLMAVLVVKIGAGGLLYLIYTRIYPDRSTADVFRYFDDSRIIYNALFSDPQAFLRIYTGIASGAADLKPYYDSMQCWDATHTSLITRIHVLLRLVSMGYYMVHTVFFCFIAFAGQVAILKAMSPLVQTDFKKRLLLLAVCLFPSTLLWSSGPLKEAVSFFAFGLFFWYFVQWVQNSYQLRKASMLCFALALYLVVIGKAYILLVAFPAILVYWLMSLPETADLLKKKRERAFTDRLLLKILGLHLLCLLIAALSTYLPEEYNVPYQLSYKQQTFIQLGETSGAGSYIAARPLGGSVSEIAKAAPLAIYNTFTRPSFMQASNPLAKMAAAENFALALIVLAGLLCSRLRKKESLAMVVFAWGFSAWLFMLIGLTTPIIGAMVRYRIMALPFLLGAAVIMFDEKTFEIRLRKVLFFLPKV